MPRKYSGFTLVEILITIIIIGVVAGLAMPMFNGTVERSRSAEARTNLNLIHTAQKIYHNDSNKYWPFVAGTSNVLATINTNLNLDLTTQFYTLSVTSGAGTGGAATYSATASRGNAGAKVFTITQAGTIAESGSY